MNSAKVTYSNGDIITTGINGTEETIKDYFKIGSVFNIGSVTDNMQTVVSCEVTINIQYNVKFKGSKRCSMGWNKQNTATVELPIGATIEEVKERLSWDYEHISELVII